MRWPCCSISQLPASRTSCPSATVACSSRPFTFYRGAALVMAADLARTPSSGIYVQACGDAHLSNFGMFATPERTMAFDVNDFDESHPAPFEWDVMRLAASIVVAADDIGMHARPASVSRSMRPAAIASRCASLSEVTFLDVWYSKVDVAGRVLEAPRRPTPSPSGRPPARPRRRPGARRTSARSTGSPSGSTASGASRPIRPSSCQPSRPRACARSWRASSSSTWSRCPRTCCHCSATTSSPTSPARSSASARWGPRPTSHCSSALVGTTPSSSS